MTGRLGRRIPTAAALFALISAVPSALASSLIVVPDGFTATEAGSADTAPLGSDIQRFQQVYGTPLLTGLNAGDQIIGLTFRLDSGSSSLPAQVIANYEIRLSQSVNGPGSLSTIFADNRGADEQIVHSGPLVILAGDFPGGSSPNAFGVMISFSTPYTYLGGPLLLEIAHDGFPAGGRNADADYPSGLAAQTAFGNGFAATTADAGLYAEAIVVRFEVSSVPEPGTFLLMILGLAGICGGRRRRGGGLHQESN